jgi:hypothetical protein
LSYTFRVLAKLDSVQVKSSKDSGETVQKIKSVGVLSSAKMSCVIYGCLGLLIIPFALILGLASVARGAGAIGGIGVLAFAIMAPVFYAGMGFVMGAITALIYNPAAKWMGGIEIQLETVGATSSNTTGLI